MYSSLATEEEQLGLYDAGYLEQLRELEHLGLTLHSFQSSEEDRGLKADGLGQTQKHLESP